MTAAREAVVSIGAISANVETLRRLAGGTPVIAVVKANGYGHGAVESAWAAVLGGAEWVGTATIDEALELRSGGIEAPILAWLHETDAMFAAAVEARVDLGLSRTDQLQAAASTPGTAMVQLKVDTGLGRNGAVDSEWQRFFEVAASLERAGHIRVRGVFSHLANAGEQEDLAQVTRFEQAIAAARAAGLDPVMLHLAATAGAIEVPSARFTHVRIGIGCYGLSPFETRDAAALGLTAAMTLSAPVVSVKRVPAGSGVSYGFDYRTTAESTLALVPLGYADGVPRSASGRGPVSINGTTFRVIGRVAMDQFVVDVGDAAVKVGDRAVLFGHAADDVPTASDWAEASSTINYEIVTRIGARVKRRYTL